jgi:hypothetical protein
MRGFFPTLRNFNQITTGRVECDFNQLKYSQFVSQKASIDTTVALSSQKTSRRQIEKTKRKELAIRRASDVKSNPMKVKWLYSDLVDEAAQLLEKQIELSSNYTCELDQIKGMPKLFVLCWSFVF